VSIIAANLQENTLQSGITHVTIGGDLDISFLVLLFHCYRMVLNFRLVLDEVIHIVGGLYLT